MMKNILSTTALVLAMSTAAIADKEPATIGGISFDQGDFFASNLIGMRIYNAEGGVDETAENSDDMVKDWDDIGEINDVIVSDDGEVRAVILGVGGFLGIGEKDVAVSMDDIQIKTSNGDSNDRFLVISTDVETLENAPAFEYPMQEQAGAYGSESGDFETTREEFFEEEEQTAADMDAADAETAETDTADTEMATATVMDREPLERPQVERDGYEEKTPVEISALTADDLEGTAVYGSNDETVGEIDELLLNDEGQIDQVVVNVGGFLGLGEKPVALSFDELQFLRNAESDSLRIYVDNTEETLKALPEWSEQS